MGLRINTNTTAMSAIRALEKINGQQQKSFERLALGQRITSAGDDAAGLSLAENLRAQIRGYAQAERNASDAISFAQVAEGGLSEIGNTLVRLRELAVQASSDTIGNKERGYINEEVHNIVSEITRIANVTSFNGVQLLNGNSAKPFFEFQVGVHNEDQDRIKFNAEENNVTSEALGIDGLDFGSIESAQAALDNIDKGMDTVFAARARLGATQNKLQSTVNNIRIAKENFAAARARIADTDIAVEASEVVKNNILQSASISILAQANTAPNQALKLL